MVSGAAAAAGLPLSALQIEITETAVMTNPERVAGMLAKLRSMGVVAAIDDFGAGYTSLSHLSTLPVHELKIDRRFVTNLLEVPGRRGHGPQRHPPGPRPRDGEPGRRGGVGGGVGAAHRSGLRPGPG
jgi:EAL domain